MTKIKLQAKNIPYNFSTSQLLNEGGIFHVTSIDKNGDMNATYEYVDDLHTQDKNARNLYIDFDCLRSHPHSKDWVEYPLSWPIDKSKSYETLKNNAPRPPKKNDEKVKSYGKFYMPKRVKLGTGDNIKKIEYSFTMDNGETIPCYNLSHLGNTHPTMLAHFYKGKPVSYNTHKITAVGDPRNLIKYLENLRLLIEDFPQIKNFNANYIIFPQSSSKFNDAIAKYIKRYVYRNAIILPSNSIYKLKVWEINYNTLVNLSLEELNSTKGIYNAQVKKYSGKSRDYIFRKTILQRAEEMMAINIFRSIAKFCNTLDYGDSSYEKCNIIVWNKIETLFNIEFNKLQLALSENNIEQVDKEEVFLRVLNRIFTSYATYKFGKKAKGLREELYSSYETLKNAFCSPNPLIFLNYDKIISNNKNDTIKNYDKIQRFSLSKQFELNSDVEKQLVDKNSRFIIIDDNYATGVSLRNAAQLLLNKGFLAKNIITLTPGDMGTASTGGKQLADVPFFGAEGDFAFNLQQGRIPFEVDDETRAHALQLYQKTKNDKKHEKRNTLADLYYKNKQLRNNQQNTISQTPNNANIVNLNQDEISTIVQEVIKKIIKIL
jgi:hypothetical protein